MSLSLAQACNPVADKSAADRTIQSYFAPPNDLQRVQDKLGDLQSFQETKWEEQASATTQGSATFLTVVYAVTYANGLATETPVLSKSGADGQFAIDKLKINSDALAQLEPTA